MILKVPVRHDSHNTLNSLGATLDSTDVLSIRSMIL